MSEFRLRRRSRRIPIGNIIYEFVILYHGSEKSLSDPNCKILIKADLWTINRSIKKYYSRCNVDLNNYLITDENGNELKFDNIDIFFSRLGEELGNE